MEASAFFARLFGRVGAEPARYLSLTYRDFGQSYHLPLAELKNFDRLFPISKIDTEENGDLYFSVCARDKDLGRFRRGKLEDVGTLSCLWVDVDIAGPGHKAKAGRLAEDENEAASFIIDAKLPDPTVIVHSGGGLHLYWVFSEPLNLYTAADRAAAERLSVAWTKRVVDAAAARGRHVDALGDLPRVLRVPTSTNRKIKGDYKTVRVLDAEGPDLDLAYAWELVCGTDVVYEKADPPGPPGPRSLPGSAAPSVPQTSSTWTTAAVIERLSRVTSSRLNHKTGLTAAQIAERLVQGEALAEPGARDDALNQAAGVVAFTCSGAPDAVVLEAVGAALDATGAQAECDVPVRENFITKLARAAEKHTTQQAEDADFAEGLFGPPRPAPDPEAAASLLAYAGAERASELTNRWIIQRGATFYFLGPNGYSPARIKDELPIAARDAFKDNADVSLTAYGANGLPREKSPPELFRQYGSLVNNVVSDMTIEHSFFDSKQHVFHEAVCRPLQREPKQNPQIDHWLRLLGGDQAEKLLDWVATITRLEQQTCALVLTGPPSTGKSIFAKALSAIWTSGGATELQRIVENFNADLLKCPLVLSDEKLPAQLLKSGNVSATLRELIGSNARTISRKHMPNSELRGAIRMIIAAQNDDILALDERMTAEDFSAVASRFLYIRVPQASADYINSLGGFNGLWDWVEGGGIAAHALWLRENRDITKGSRFIVQGDIGRVRQLLVTKNRLANLCCEWIAKYIDEPQEAIVKTGRIRIGNGRILVNATVVQKFWDQYIHSDKVPSLQNIGFGLRSIGKDKQRIGQHMFREIGVNNVVEWAIENHVGDERVLLRRVEEILDDGAVYEEMEE